MTFLKKIKLGLAICKLKKMVTFPKEIKKMAQQTMTVREFIWSKKFWEYQIAVRRYRRVFGCNLRLFLCDFYQPKKILVDCSCFCYSPSWGFGPFRVLFGAREICAPSLWALDDIRQALLLGQSSLTQVHHQDSTVLWCPQASRICSLALLQVCPDLFQVLGRHFDFASSFSFCFSSLCALDIYS